ncbi:MAG TPA: hypothetical protein VK448_11845 [Dissulfurispiraceae bacterium]|nr:hypothetical protein [Dissulfurispiraceae bacterium]
MKDRITVSLSLFVDLKIEDGADIADIISGLSCACRDTTGEAEVISIDVNDRSLVVENEEEVDAE